MCGFEERVFYDGLAFVHKWDQDREEEEEEEEEEGGGGGDRLYFARIMAELVAFNKAWIDFYESGKCEKGSVSTCLMAKMNSIFLDFFVCCR